MMKLDNCGSFDRLIPLLTKDVGFLTIDLPGHGYSSKLPLGTYYHNINYPILIRRLQNYFQWPKISLLGHSLGGISSFTYTMIFPDTVDFVMCLDGVKPTEKKNNMARMAEGINDLFKYDKQITSTEEPPSYTMDQLKRVMGQANFRAVSVEYCHYILERNIAPSKMHPGKYYFTRDPRLKSRLILNWPHKDILEGGKRVTCPIFMAKCLGSGYNGEKETFYDLLEVLKESSSDCQLHYVEGEHHVHLTNPSIVSDLINDFIAKHDKSDRSTGRSIDEVLVI